MRISAIVAISALSSVALICLPMSGIGWHIARWALYFPILLVGITYGSSAGLLAGLASSLLCAMVVVSHGIGDATWSNVFAPDFAVVGMLGGRCLNIWPRFRKLATARKKDARPDLFEISEPENKLDPNPLASIEIAARLLAEDDTPANLRQELAGIISTECEHLSASVAGLLHQPHEASPLQVRAADISAIVDAAVRGAAFILYGQGVIVRREVAPDLPPIHCNPDQIRNLLMSVTVVAAQSAPAGSELVLRASQKDDGLVLEVRELGLGSLVGRFERRFFSPPAGSASSALAAAYEIVLQHGGRIDGTISVRKGSEFSVWLPLHPNYTDGSRQSVGRGGRRQPPARHPATS